MARHKVRNFRSSAVVTLVIAFCASLFLTSVGSSPANAELYPVAPGKSVTPKNSVVTGKCNMTVQAVNTATGQVTLRLAAQAKPTSLFGYGTNAYTQIFCSVYDSSFNLVATHNPFRNGPTVPNTGTQNAVPYSSQYFVCGAAFVKLNNGNTSLTATVCA
jgi:hypothetical protein